jgi:hypothetical protein
MVASVPTNADAFDAEPPRDLGIRPAVDKHRLDRLTIKGATWIGLRQVEKDVRTQAYPISSCRWPVRPSRLGIRGQQVARRYS